MDFIELSDNKLLDNYLSGDHSAANILIERHRKRIYDYIYMMVRDHAITDDIFQETLIRMMKSLDDGRYRESGKFLSWVLRIAHNLVIDHFRQKKQQNNVSETEAGYDILNSKRFSDPTVEEKIICQQIENDLRKLIDTLPVEQKEVVILRYYMSMSFKDIADQTGVSINTALGRMRYALINLRKAIDENQLTMRFA